MSNTQEQALRKILEMVGKAPVMPKLQKIHSIATNALGENADTDTTPKTTTPTVWDETAEDCRNCEDWDNCFDEDEDQANQLQARDDDDDGEYHAEGESCFKNMHD